MFTCQAACIFLINLAVYSAWGQTEVPSTSSPGQHYQECWRIVESLCEKNGSSGCSDLVVLCGQLLRDHLVEAHQPQPCPDNPQRHVRSLEDPERNSTERNFPMSSVSLSNQLTHLATGNNHRRILKKYIMKKLVMPSTSVTSSAAEPSTTSTPPTTINETPAETTTSQKLSETEATTTSPTESTPGITEEDAQHTRRNEDIRGMLPEGQAMSFPSPLEKRTGYRGEPKPDYMIKVLEYRQYFLEDKEDYMKEWLMNDSGAFKAFLHFWKNSLPASIRLRRGH